MCEGLMESYKGWQHKLRVNKEDDKVVEYHIHFYQKSDDWYNEIRYDSHEIKGGKKSVLPHFHLKIKSSFKEPDVGKKELQEIIAIHLPKLRSVVER